MAGQAPVILSWTGIRSAVRVVPARAGGVLVRSDLAGPAIRVDAADSSSSAFVGILGSAVELPQVVAMRACVTPRPDCCRRDSRSAPVSAPVHPKELLAVQYTFMEVQAG